jgi:hypothetical protein
MNKWKSESGKYTGTIAGFGKNKQLTLDQKSKDLLAKENLKRVLEQN